LCLCTTNLNWIFSSVGSSKMVANSSYTFYEVCDWKKKCLFLLNYVYFHLILESHCLPSFDLLIENFNDIKKSLSFYLIIILFLHYCRLQILQSVYRSDKQLGTFESHLLFFDISYIFQIVL
jgi:hypothetical protein